MSLIFYLDKKNIKKYHDNSTFILLQKIAYKRHF